MNGDSRAKAMGPPGENTGGSCAPAWLACGWTALLVCALSFAAACGGSTSDPAAAGNEPADPSAAPAIAESGAGAESPASSGQTDGPPAVAGPQRENDILQLQVIEAGFWPAYPAPAGRRYYTVGLRGRSKSAGPTLLGGSKGDEALIDVRRFVYAQNDRGCVTRPELEVAGVDRLAGNSMTFPPSGHADVRLAFLVPADTERVRVLIASADMALAVPAGPDFTPSHPTPVAVIEDGSVMRIHVLPMVQASPDLPTPEAGRERVILDVAVENLSSTQGIEFQTSQQLRLMDANGRFVQMSGHTLQLGCRLDDGDVVPPGQTRRLQAIYDLPAGSPRKLHYRGFEKEEAVVDLR
jgi:hypothetical protein